jgi:hypothetical protein
VRRSVYTILRQRTYFSPFTEKLDYSSIRDKPHSGIADATLKLLRDVKLQERLEESHEAQKKRFDLSRSVGAKGESRTSARGERHEEEKDMKRRKT